MHTFSYFVHNNTHFFMFCQTFSHFRFPLGKYQNSRNIFLFTSTNYVYKYTIYLKHPIPLFLTFSSKSITKITSFISVYTSSQITKPSASLLFTKPLLRRTRNPSFRNHTPALPPIFPLSLSHIIYITCASCSTLDHLVDNKDRRVHARKSCLYALSARARDGSHVFLFPMTKFKR